MILELRAIDTYYGLGHILHGLSLDIAEGEVVALLGRNGAGKTTTMRSIAGLAPPARGQIRFKGRDIAGLDPHRVSRLGIALVPETRGIFSYLTARENLAIARSAGSRWQMDDVLGRFPGLRQRLESKGRSLSGGEQQMLAIGRALMSNPRVLLMDEPSEGLAPQIVAEVMATIRRLKESGLSIVLVEQSPKLVFDIADDMVILNSGKVAVAATAAKLRSDKVDLHQHLGVF